MVDNLSWTGNLYYLVWVGLVQNPHHLNHYFVVIIIVDLSRDRTLFSVLISSSCNCTRSDEGAWIREGRL